MLPRRASHFLHDAFDLELVLFELLLFADQSLQVLLDDFLFELAVFHSFVQNAEHLLVLFVHWLRQVDFACCRG